MANKSFVVKYLIQARDGFSVAAGKVGRGFDKITKKSKRAERQVKKSSNSMRDSFKNMAGAAIGFLGAREFLDVGMRFENAMADVSAITGATGKDLAFMRGEILGLAKDSITAQDQVANAFKLIASAKSELLKDPKGLSVVAEQVLLLANASGITIPEAVQASVGALNQFGEGADKAARFVNVMAAGSKIGASEVYQTSAALVDAGFASASAGLSFEQTNAAIQVLAKSEIKGARAGVSLRNILTIMGTSLKGKFDPSVIGINKSLEEFSKLNLTNTELTKMFGRESKDAAGFLIKNIGLFKEWTRQLKGTDSAQEQANKRLAVFSKQMQKVRVIINDSMIKTFNRLSPQITRLAEGFGKFMDGIKSEQIDAFASSLGVLLDAAVLIGKAFGVVLSTLKSIGDTIGQVTAALGTGDFGQFDFQSELSKKREAGKAEAADRHAKIMEGFTARSKVDVGVSVGLEGGLRETSKPVIGGSGLRRADVGMVAG